MEGGYEMKDDNVISFPLEKEDIMRLKPEDICGRVWKVSRYGSAAHINDDRVKLKVVQTQPKSSSDTSDTRELKTISPKIIEKFDDYIEDTAEKLWNILKGLFKKV